MHAITSTGHSPVLAPTETVTVAVFVQRLDEHPGLSPSDSLGSFLDGLQNPQETDLAGLFTPIRFPHEENVH